MRIGISKTGEPYPRPLKHELEKIRFVRGLCKAMARIGPDAIAGPAAAAHGPLTAVLDELDPMPETPSEGGLDT